MENTRMYSWLKQLGNRNAPDKAFDESLKRSAPRPQPPSELRNSIMRAVRNTARERNAEASNQSPARRWRLMPFAAAAALAAICAGLLWRGSMNSISSRNAASELNGPQTVLEAGDALNRGALPSAIMAPLSNEWTSIQRDIDYTGNFLLSSVP